MQPSCLQNCRWVPWAIASAFVLVAVANGTLAYFATHSSTGLVTERPFNKGNGYNRVLAAADRQDALGWQSDIAFQAGSTGQRSLVFKVKDAEGHPVEGLDVAARITRPVERMAPLSLDLQAASGGTYQGKLDLPKAGQWAVHVTARRGEDFYEAVTRIVAR